MLFAGLMGITVTVLIVAFTRENSFLVFLAGVNFGWGLLMIFIGLVLYRAERKREQRWRKDD